MPVLILLVACLECLYSQPASAVVSPEIRTLLDRVDAAAQAANWMAIDRPISEGSLIPVVAWLDARPVDSTVNVAFNSPGGSVGDAMVLLQAMNAAKARGINIRCYVKGGAISAAFWILTGCSERYAVEHSVFLFHRIRQEGHFLVTAPFALHMARVMQQVDEEMVQNISDCTTASVDFIWRHMNAETYWTVVGLRKALPGFLDGSAATYPGVAEAMANPHTMRPGGAR